MIRVLIVDDHKMTRIGIKFAIEEDPDIKVIAQACDGQEGIAICASLDIDVVLMDLNLPMLSGVEAITTLISNNPNTKILVLTGSSSSRELQEALRAGAKGYCLKDTSYNHLIKAIKQVVSGETWFDSALTAGEQNKSKSDSYNLSNRELQVLALVVEGKTNQEIALQLNMGVDTAKGHLKQIMAKLAVNDRTQVAVKAVREKLI